MSEYLTHPSTHPEWHGEEPEGASVLGEAYQCLQCPWRGRGGSNATAHHLIAHHAIGLTYNPGIGAVSFACCSGRPQVNRKDAAQ